METKTVKLYALSYKETRAYMVAALLIVGNIVLPQICHLIPQGGLTWLPIYFFTLIGAYKYGWRVGLMTALLSPTVNSLLFGMPIVAMLPAIISKSVLLALAASWVARRFNSVSLLLLLGVVLTYQVAGSLVEWAMKGSFFAAMQDFRIGLPGMAFQIVGGFLVLRYLLKK